MNMLSNMPVRRKLKAISMISGGLALVVACAAFVAYDYYDARETLAHRAMTLAEIVGRQTTAALSFQDAKAAEEILESLSAEQHLVAAGIYDARWTLFARYRAPAARIDLPASVTGASAPAFEDGRLVVSSPIEFNGQHLGVTRIEFGLGSVTESLRTKLVIAGIVLLASLLGAYVLTWRLEGVVTKPILHLAHTVASVSETKDYSFRALSDSTDEMGTLIRGFNEMLGQIEARDAELKQARSDLERRVEERTADLQREIVERVAAQESLEESEDRFRQLVESSPDAIVITAGDRLTFFNPGAVALFGAQDADDLKRRSLAELVPAGSSDRVRERIRRAADHNEASGLHEERILRLDGRPVDVELLALPFSGKHGAAAQLVLRDITRRKELDRMKNEFISTVSHELRTPLTSIRGSLKLVAAGVTGVLPAKAMGMVTIAHDSCERLIHLVNDILDMQKIEAGKMTFDLRILDLAALLGKAAEGIRAYAQTFGVSVAVDNRAAGARLRADGDRLMQVLTNLLSNAAKFSPKGATVTLSAEARGAKIRIAVADRGPGIPEEFRGRIFQKFSQADGSDAKSKQGTGLGLSITKAIVERLGGTIGFDSIAGQGTTFYVDLPRHEEPAPVAARETAGLPRILVCEDDPNTATVLRVSLELAGFAVDVAAFASDAKALAERHDYAAMTLDLRLPDQEGSALLQELRRAPKTRELPVVVVSAYLDEAKRKLSGDAYGVVDWLEKPIHEERLSTTLRWIARGGKRQAKILHLEAAPSQVRAVREALEGIAAVCPVGTAADAAVLLDQESFDAVVLGAPSGPAPMDRLAPRLRRPDGSAIPVIPAGTNGDELFRKVRAVLGGPASRTPDPAMNGARP